MCIASKPPLVFEKSRTRALASAARALRLMIALWGTVLALCSFSGHAQAQTLPPLSVSFWATPDPAMPGDQVVFNVLLANPSTTTPTGAFQLNVAVPQSMAINDFNSAGCTANPCRFGSTLYWSVPTIAAGTSTHYQFTAGIDNSVAYPAPSAGTVLSATLSATVATKPISATANVTIGSQPMSLGVSGTPFRVAPGGLVTYTASYGNIGASALPATMSVSIPSGATFVSATGGGALAGSAVQWDLGSVAAGFSDRRQFTVKVADAAVAGTFLVAQGQLLNTTNQQSLLRETTTNLVAATQLLALSIVGTPDPVTPGGAIYYRLLATNNSTNTATGTFEVNVNVPRFGQISYYHGGGCTKNPCRNGGIAYWSFPSIPAGGTWSVPFTVTVDNSVNYPPPADGSVLSADATAFVFGGMMAHSTVTVDSGTHLSLAISGVPNRVAPGAALTYSVAYGNTGASAVATTLSVPVPNGTTFVSATGGGALSNGVVQWALGSVASGFSDRLQFTVNVPDSAVPGASIIAEAELSNSTTKRSLVRESTSSLVAVDQLLSLSVSATPDPVAPGASLVYTLNIANKSTNTPTGSFELDFNMPRSASVTYYNGGGCTANPCRFGSILYWTIDSIPAGGSTKLYFTVAVDNSVTNPPPPDGSILFSDVTAYVFGGVTVANTVTVSGGNHLNLTIGGAPSRVPAGGTLTYTLSAGNGGTKGVATLLSLPLPIGTSFVSATSGGALNGSAVEWDLGTLASGAIQQRQVSLKVADAASNGQLISGAAELLDPTSRRTLVREATSNLVADDALLSFAISANPTTVSPGSTVVYTLNLTNNSTNTPTGSFSTYVFVPPYLAVTQYGGAGCTSNPCRFGSILYWTVPTIAAGGGATLTFTGAIDNSVTYPPPANGTVLDTKAMAYVFGGVQANVSVYTGGPPLLTGPVGSGGTGAGGNSGVGGGNSTAGNTAASGGNSTGGEGTADLAGAGGEAGDSSSVGTTGGKDGAGGKGSTTGSANGGDSSSDAGSSDTGSGDTGSGVVNHPSGSGKSGGCSMVSHSQTQSTGNWSVLALLGLAFVARKKARFVVTRQRGGSTRG